MLVHWDAPEAEARVARLASLNYSASFVSRAGPPLLREIKANPPSAVLIDLSRLPSQGRDVGVELRVNKSTRTIPIVFVDGRPEKVLTVRQSLPDAVFTTWTHIEQDLARALSRPARALFVPETPSGAVSGTSMAGKLGIEPSSVLALLNAPPEFTDALEPLPKGVSVRRQMGPECDMILWFVRSRRELQDAIGLRTTRLAQSRLWVLWPKRSTGLSRDLDDDAVRELGQAEGLVEAKAASIDATWSGMLFERRLA